MICPKCGKEFLSAETTCPYCGEEIKAEENVTENTEETAQEVVEEIAEEVVEEVAEEVAEETAEEVAEETAEEVAEAEENEEATEEYDAEEAAEILAAANAAGKKADAATKVLAALVVVAAIVAAFFMGGRFLGGDVAETTAETTTAEATNTDAPATTGGDVTAAPDEGEVPFDGIFGENYQLAYPNGYDYKGVDISEFVTLGEYKGKTTEVINTGEFADGEFEEQLNYFLLQYAEEGEAVTDRPAKLYDSVVIDYKGTLNGVAFEGGTAEQQDITLGQGQFIPGFEEGIVGMSIGETKDIPVTFPADYHAEELAGKAVVFTITLHSITENIFPEYTDEFVSENFGIDTVADFEKELRAMKAEEAVSEKYSAVLGIVTDAAVMKKYPSGAVEDYMYRQVNSDVSAAESYSMSAEAYINAYYGMSVSEYEAQVRAMSEDMIKQEFALYAVAAAEGLSVTDEETSTEIANYLEYYGKPDVQTLCTEMGITEELFENSLHFSVIYTKVMEFMIENTTFTVVE